MMTETEILDRIDKMSRERLRLCITHAWVRPAESSAGHLFDETDLARLTLIAELSDDLGVNDDALPLILNLLDEVSSLRRRIRVLDQALAEQGPDICEAVIARLQTYDNR